MKCWEFPACCSYSMLSGSHKKDCHQRPQNLVSSELLVW